MAPTHHVHGHCDFGRSYVQDSKLYGCKRPEADSGPRKSAGRSGQQFGIDLMVKIA